MALIERGWIEGLPKAELHVHLEGALTEDGVLRLCRKYSEKPWKVNGSPFGFNNLSGFLEMLDHNCSLFRESKEVERLAYDFSLFQKSCGILYSEVLINPAHWKNISLSDLLKGIEKGFEEGCLNGGSDCYIILSLRRDIDNNTIKRTIQWLVSCNLPRLIAFSVDGDESVPGSGCERFREAFSKAHSLGLHLVAHAGESSGPEGVLDALDILKVDRIDHGVRAIEDAGLVDRLAEKQIPLDICYTSNLYGLYTEATHPLDQLLKRGVMVNISTDDPLILKIDINGEYERVSRIYSYGKAEIKKLAGNSFKSSFLSSSRKKEYLHMLEEC